jgi:putative oxidoreductase
MYAIRGLLSVLARLMIAAIFLMSAVGNKIPNFNGVAEAMAQQGVPQPKILLGGAIAFLILGALSIVLGYRARLGALMLLSFLAAATYYFHDFWTVPADDAERKQAEMIAFMKNLSLMGTMLFLIANGSGPWSLSGPAAPAAEETAEQVEEEE